MGNLDQKFGKYGFLVALVALIFTLYTYLGSKTDAYSRIEFERKSTISAFEIYRKNCVKSKIKSICDRNLIEAGKILDSFENVILGERGNISAESYKKLRVDLSIMRNSFFMAGIFGK